MNLFIRCRTCFKQNNGEIYTSINNVCYLNTSVKEVITTLVPQMGKTLRGEDITCKNCFEILKNCMIFIEKCLEVERKLEADRQILNLCNESEGAVTIGGSEETNQLLPNSNADLSDNHIQKESTEKKNMQENCVTNERNVGSQQVTCIRLDDSTSEESVPKLHISFLLKPQFSRNNIPIKKPATTCDVNLYQTQLSLENAPDETNFSANEDNLKKDHDLKFSLNNSYIRKDHSYCTQRVLLNRKGNRIVTPKHNRVVTVNQPNGKLIPNFITCLLRSKIKVLQISTNPEPNISSTKKRILLLGKRDNLKCPKCSKFCKYLEIYNQHIINCQGSGPKEQVCPLCNETIQAHRMKFHRRQHRERICQTCSERFTSKEDYELHLQFHPPHICDKCGKGFVNKMSLRSHKSSHNAPNSFICEICGKGFKDICTLRYHIRLVHQDDKLLKCDRCPKSFKTNHQLKQHIKFVHEKKNQVQCSQCGILLSNREALPLHIRLRHLKLKPFECKICGKQFGRADYVRTHLKSHTGEREKPRKRNRLGIKHDGSKVLTCKFCGKCISSVTNLKLHLKTHIKTKRYPCHFCPLTFAGANLRSRHELIHRNVDNIVRCNICFKRLKTKEELEEHIATTHKNPRYKCDTCGQLFHRKYLLNHHNSQEHMTADDLQKSEEMIYKCLLESVGRDR